MLCEGISFQNVLGISLLLGEMNSNFPGETGLDSPGEVLNCGGSDSFEYLIYRRGTIFRPRLSGMLVKNTYAAGEMLRSTGGYPTSLRPDNITWRECTDCLLSGELRCTGYLLQLNLL